MEVRAALRPRSKSSVPVEPHFLSDGGVCRRLCLFSPFKSMFYRAHQALINKEEHL